MQQAMSFLKQMFFNLNISVEYSRLLTQIFNYNFGPKSYTNNNLQSLDQSAIFPRRIRFIQFYVYHKKLVI